MDPRSIEQDNFETNSRIFPKQLFHSFPVRSNDSGLDGRNHDGSHKKWTPTSHNPTHLSFARLGPSSPSDVPLRYTTTSCHPSLGASPTPVGQGRANIRVADEPVIWSYRRREVDCHHPPHPSTSSKAIILKDDPTSQDEEVPRLHSNPR